MELMVIAAAVFLVFRLVIRRAVVSDNAGVVGPVGWNPDTNWRVVRPLARAEVRRVLRHPAFIAGVLLTPLILVLAATESENTWRSVSAGIALALVPLGWMTIIATNLVALRPKRTGTEELFAALPAPQPTRSSALLTTLIAPVAVAAVLAIGCLAFVSTRDELRGSFAWDETAAGLLIVAGSVCVGTAVARWLPSAGFGLLAVVATIVLQARFLDVTTWPWDRSEGDPLRFLGFLAEPTDVRDSFLEVRPSGWHLTYLGGLVAVMAGVTLAREGLRRPVVVVVLSAGVLVAAGAGWMQTRPLSPGREDAMVAYLTDPDAHQICEASAGVRYCAYPDFTADIAEWRTRVDATLRLFPTGAVANRDPLQVIQRPAIVASNENCSAQAFEYSLPPGVAARLSPAELWPADNHVHPPFDEESFPCSGRDDVHGFFLAVQTAAWATGLPPAPHDDNQRCTASDQARAVIALWAGAAASPDGARTLRDVTTDGSKEDRTIITFAEWDDPPMWGVDYAVADAEIALAMLALPVAEVRATLDRDWARWTNAETSTSTLAVELGIDAGRTAPRASAPAGCP